MDNQDNITDTTLDGATLEEASSVGAAVSESPKGGSATAIADSLSLTELNHALGKTFTSKEAAIKAVKDTFSYVGKRKEDVAKEVVDTSKFISAERYETDMFYAGNPDYTDLRQVIDSMAKAEGKRPHEIVNSDAFKNVFEKVKGFNEVQKTRTVLESNPRITSSRTKIQEARQALKEGDEQGANNAAVRAALESAGL